MSRPRQCADVLSRLRGSKGIVFINGTGYLWSYRTALDLPSGWNLILSGANIGCIGALNEVFRLYPDEPWYGFIGDDEFLLPESLPDWSERLIKAAGSWDVSHGWDNWNHGKRAQGYVCIGGKLARAVGYLGILGCWHHFGFDCMWEWLAAMKEFGGGGAIKNILVPEVRVEHRHYKLDMAVKYECYSYADDSFEKDREEFWRWITKDMPGVVKRIEEAKQLC